VDWTEKQLAELRGLGRVEPDAYLHTLLLARKRRVMMGDSDYRYPWLICLIYATQLPILCNPFKEVGRVG